MKDTPYILGIWDGHDAGAALIRDNTILFAVNEERLSRRKLEIGFPSRAIEVCLKQSGISPSDVSTISCSTSDLSKTLQRVFPSFKERHYLLRRRKIKPTFLQNQKFFKFWITTKGTTGALRAISRWKLSSCLQELGFNEFELILVDHHHAHAATAACAGPFEDSLVITLDGVGDGLSGSINVFESGALKRISAIPASHSLGIFFEQVTYLLNMRELEDEGKVMALSDYSYEIPPEENLMKDFFTVKGLSIKATHTPVQMFKKLSEILWKTPWEIFCRMAQDVLERCVAELFSNALEKTGKHNVAWCGGIASNIKLNMKLRHLPELHNWFVFPHMGDGGLALGAALLAAFEKWKISRIAFPHAYLGPEFSEDEIEAFLKTRNVKYSYVANIEERVARLIADEHIVFWFQGRSEFGPRALGNRSILAPAHSLKCRDDLNQYLKRRNWFQPFCPSLLKEDAPLIIEDFDGKPSPFMTMAYRSRSDIREKIVAVIGKDGSLRPQIVDDENPRYRRLLEEVKKLTGLGIVLNTSFNRHGEPMVNAPAEALRTFEETGCSYMTLGNFLLEK